MRSRFLSATGLAMAMMAACPALAEDAAAKSDAEGAPIVKVLGDVVEGIGGVLKVLVGPPSSSPTPYLGLEGTARPVKPEPAVMATPVPMPEITPPEQPAIAPAAVAAPKAQQPLPMAPSPPPQPIPAAQAVVVQPAQAAIRPAPAAQAAIRPAPATQAAIVQPAQAAIRPASSARLVEPVCARRVAATATQEQAAGLPRCPRGEIP
jgi:hypothetical protein